MQDVVNDQKLPVYNGELRVVSGSQVSLTLDTMLDTPLKTTVGPMKMTLASNDEKDAPEFLSVDFPKEGVLHKTNVTVPAQVTNVLDQDALVDWFGKLFDAKEKEVRVGSPKSQVKLNGLDYHPTLSQVAHIKGLQYLEGFSLKSINFQLPPDKDGYNTRGTLNLPNHGSLSLYLGDAAFNLLAGDATIGIMKIDGLTLKKGMNHPEFYGKLFFDQLLPNIAEVLAGQGNSLKNGELLTHLGGNATLVDGKHVGYLERVLAPKRIPLPIPVTMFVGQLLKSMTAGSGTDTSDLVDVLGGAFGNKTLIDDVMGHWKSFSNAADKTAKKTTKQKRAETPIGSRMAFVKSMLKLGLRTKTKAR